MTRHARSRVWSVLLGAAGVVLAVTVALVLRAGEVDDPERRERGSNVRATPADRLLVIAHRGASAYAPHDTVAAAREAVARGADAVEADIRQTRDGHLVALFHASLAPTTNVEQVFPGRRPWRVESFTLAEVRRLDSGSWFGPEFEGEPVPTLAELADALAGTDVQLVVEVKTPRRYPGVADRLLREVGSRPRRYREIESFDLDFIRRLARRSPPVRLSAAKAVPFDQLADLAAYADAVNSALADADAEYVARAKELGLEVKVWSLNSRRAVRRAVRLGVDGIYSHRPDLVLDTLGR